MKGAMEVVSRHCSTLHHNHTPFSVKERAHFEGVASEMGHQGLRGTYLHFTYYLCVHF